MIAFFIYRYLSIYFKPFGNLLRDLFPEGSGLAGHQAVAVSITASGITLPAEDEPHEAVWLQVSFAITSQLIAESILISFDDSKCVAISVAP